MADDTGTHPLPRELEFAEQELRRLLQAEGKRVGPRRDLVVPFDANVAEAARRYVVALRAVDGGRQELLRRSRLIDTMTASGSGFAQAWQAARPLLGATTSEPPNDWRTLVDEAQGTGLLDVLHLRNVISHIREVEREEEETALTRLSQMAQQVIDEAEQVHTEGCRALLLLGTHQTTADDSDMQPLFDSLPHVEAARYLSQTPGTPMLILAAVESLTAWAGLQAASLTHGATASETAGSTTGVAEKDDQPAPVILRGPDESPIVRGIEKPRLTRPRYDAVKVLVDAKGKGIVKDVLDHKSGHTEARKLLKAVAQLDDDWQSVIVFPKIRGDGYAIR